MTFADLFCGIGGFRLALERAGAECVYANDNDRWASEIYRRHWGHGELEQRDIRWVSKKHLPRIDLLTAGWPCQGFSVAGKRAGLRDARSGLFWELIRLVEAAQPRWILLENVPGLFSSGSGRDFTAVLRELDKCGYDAAWRCFNARYFRVPHRRRRVFIVGSARGGPDPGEVLFEREGGEGDFAPSKGERHEVAASVGSRVDQHPPQAATFVVNMDATPKVAEDMAMTLRPDGHSGIGRSGGAQYVAYGAMLRGRNGGSQLELRENEMPSLRAIQGGGGRPMVMAFAENSRAELVESDVVGLKAGGGKPGQSYPTIREGMTIRRLMPIECERLQGFPDGWTEGLSDRQRYKALGNAVCVNVVEWIARRIVRTEEAVSDEQA